VQQQLGEVCGGLDTKPPQQPAAVRGEVRVQVERALRSGDGRARRGKQSRDRAGDLGVQPAGPGHPPGYLRRLAEGKRGRRLDRGGRRGPYLAAGGDQPVAQC